MTELLINMGLIICGVAFAVVTITAAICEFAIWFVPIVVEAFEEDSRATLRAACVSCLVFVTAILCGALN